MEEELEEEQAATGPGRVVHEAELGQAKPGYVTPGQAPTSVSPPCRRSTLLSPSCAISVSLSRAHPLTLSLEPAVSLVALFLCLPAPACLYLPVGRPDPFPYPSTTLLRLSRAASLPLGRLDSVSPARGINTPVGRLRAAKRPKPRSRKRRRLYRVTPRAAFVALCAASESIVRELFQPIGPP